MNGRDSYAPGPATGAEIQKDGGQWTLVIVRELRHQPELVWEALTDPAQLREWAPFDADRNLGAPGLVKLSTVGARAVQVSETTVSRAVAPRELEYNWGDNQMRWELEPTPGGTRLRLWHRINRRYIAMGAAGWHICFDVLGRFLAGHPIGRIVAGDAMNFDWQRLHAEYARQFGVAAPHSRPQHEQGESS